MNSERSDSTPNINPENVAKTLNGTAKIDEEPLSIVKTESTDSANSIDIKRSAIAKKKSNPNKISFSQSQLIVITVLLMGLGLWFRLPWLGIAGSVHSSSALIGSCLYLG